MFAKTIIDSDAFLDMPATTQLLYFHLSMRADDEGFINKPKSIMRICRCNDDDMKLLIAKKFIIPFESGIVVIKHWKIHNYIAKDRFTETKYKGERSQLQLDENKSYTLCMQDVHSPMTQVRLGKDSIGKDNNIYTPVQEPEAPEKPSEKNKIYLSIIDYLNQKTGKKFKISSKKTKSSINARLKEGYTLDDFKTVIDNKCSEWLNDPKMNQYLRPETLFGTKFASYLYAKTTPEVKQEDLEFLKKWSV